MSNTLNNKSVAIILINYKDYAEKYLAECLSSLRKQDYEGKMKIFIVDNETTPETASFLLKNVPEAELVLNKNNDGFAKGNNDAMKLAIAQGFDYIILFNMDTVVEKNCVSEMVKVVEMTNFQFPISNQILNPKSEILNKLIAAVQARLMLHDEKEKINTVGNVTHFLGFGYGSGYKEEYKSLSLRAPSARGEAIFSSLVDENSIIDRHGLRPRDDKVDHGLRPRDDKEYNNRPPRDGKEDDGLRPCLPDRQACDDNTAAGLPRPADAGLAMTTDICYPSGAAVLFNVEVLKKIGLFDEEYWMYNEDQDMGWRIWLAGYRCVLAPEAVVYHKYEFSKSMRQYFWMDRNRIISIIKYYRLGTLLLILPAFIIMELGLILFALKGGWFKEKLKVWAYFINPFHWPYLWRARGEAQKLRRVKDKDIMHLLSGKILHQEVGSIVMTVVNEVFDVYWRIIKKIIFW